MISRAYLRIKSTIYSLLYMRLVKYEPNRHDISNTKGNSQVDTLFQQAPRVFRRKRCFKIQLKRCLFLNKFEDEDLQHYLKLTLTQLLLKVFCTESELVFQILKLSGVFIIRKTSRWLIPALASNIIIFLWNIQKTGINIF